MDASTAQGFACPIHKTVFVNGLFCPQCGKDYPAVNGIPVLINDAHSVFATADYLDHKGYDGASGYAGSLDKRAGLRQLYRRVMRHLNENTFKGDFGVEQALDAVLATQPQARILMIGSGDVSVRGNVTYTDVAFGQHVQCIADAHDLPFADGSFDVCVAVAVLEHVADPYRCVAELMRVLRPGGHVYAETPFMQPVHMGAYDFTRFTHLGHRRLFRHFDEVRSGIAVGPGASAGQMICYALTSLSDGPAARKWLRMLGILVTYPLRWLDRFTFSRRSAYDSASGFYFFGTLRETPISDRELLGFFRGG